MRRPTRVSRGARGALAAAALLLAACTGGEPAADAAADAGGGAPSRSPSPSLWLLAPPGDSAAVGPTTTERDLARRFGAAAVRADSIHLGEGEYVQGTALFPDDTARRLEITWQETTTRDRPDVVRAVGGAWVAHPGVRRGMPLEEVERLNGRPFTMTGFGWDYGGTVVSWSGGRLDSLPPGVTRLLVRFDKPRDARMTDAESRRVSGDRAIPSSDPVMRRIRPRVGDIEVRFR